jgi:ABC-type glycerol-3-phosphate transport system substrate-binding protein
LPGASPTPLILVEARILRLWLPPRFDPQADSVAAHLLEGRLTEFEAAHPGLKLDIRIKAEDGETGLLQSLSVTNVAAPSALPDLIALRRADLESAASLGLLHPIDGLSTLLDDPNWYPYARDLGHLQNIGYGLPFAGDALILAHPSELVFSTWEDILAGDELLLFPAGDPQALAPLSLYVSAGGRLVNEQGLPTLEEQPLTQVLTLIQDGVAAGVFSPSLLNLDSDEQSFQAYRDGRSRLAITWATNLTQLTPGVMQPIPGLEQSPHTFADGWSWALAGSTSENQQLATELAEFLMEDAFLSEWTRETGYLPTRIGDPAEPNRLIEAAQVLPSQQVLTVLGPIMNQAVSRILIGEEASAVVRSVLEEVP